MEFEKCTGDLAGFTVLLPAVSVGNVGQLCIDVILENLSPKPSFTSQVLHPGLIPVVGLDPTQSGSSLSTALQMHVDSEKKLVIFQIRSGILPGQGAAFIEDFVDWFKVNKCSELIVVGSSHAHERTDTQLTGSPLRYMSTVARTFPQGFITLEPRKKFPGQSFSFLCRVSQM